MKIHILCNDGSPLNKLWSDIHDGGVGGAELALLSLSEQFVKDGHEVHIFNRDTDGATIEQQGIVFRHIEACPPEEADRMLIVFRSPNHRIAVRQCERLIWWSTDQYTVGNFARYAGLVDFIVAISPFHLNYLATKYNIPYNKMAYIDLGVRAEYSTLDEVEKQKNLCLFCSVPDRGLPELHGVWPRILSAVPDAELIITSDYRLWGWPNPRNHEHRLMWSDAERVNFMGRVPRKDLVKLQLASDLLIYPCTYDELFCISVAECEVAGAYPITSGLGALPTTNAWGTTLAGDPRHPQFSDEFVNRAVSLLTDERDYLEESQRIMAKEARERFLWPNIAKRWYKLFETGSL
jgi:glycosyltransferase involved in cell wall biosynthesis